MTEDEYARKLGQLDRLLNDPEVPMQAAEVWSLLAEIANYGAAPDAMFQADPAEGYWLN